MEEVATAELDEPYAIREFLEEEHPTIEARLPAPIGGPVIWTMAAVGYVLYLREQGANRPVTWVEVLFALGLAGVAVSRYVAYYNVFRRTARERQTRRDDIAARCRAVFETDGAFELLETAEIQSFRNWICSPGFRKFVQMYRENGGVLSGFNWEEFFGHEEAFTDVCSEETIRRFAQLAVFQDFLNSVVRFGGADEFPVRLQNALAETYVSPEEASVEA